MMKNLWLAATVLMFATASAPASANDKDEAKAVVGALILLGAAAMAHHEDHHHGGRHHDREDHEASFERGYRDGLHNAEYDSRHSNREYGEGYSAGMKERDNRLAHRRNNDNGAPNAPSLSMRACVGEASAKWGRNPRDIVVVKTRKAASNDFYVEVAAGHKHGNCEVSASGEVYLFQNGRI